MASTRTETGATTALTPIHRRAAGIDIGVTFHVVAVPPDLDAEPVRTFHSFTGDLHALADWLAQVGVTTVAMGSTGIYWVPVFGLLEARGVEVVLVNARDAENVPGRKTGIACSMSRKGDCWDNAVAESFFGTLKTELVHDAHFTSRAEATAAIGAYIDGFYNRQRRHSTLGYVSPLEYELRATRRVAAWSHWGHGFEGQLGDGLRMGTFRPVVPRIGDRATAVTAGRAHSCALLVDGRVQCWGADTWGRLGTATGSRTDVPQNVVWP